jgi:hypothetical protein
MKIIDGNIWQLLGVNDAAVIPVNVGWRKNGTAIMGKGLAYQANFRFPNLALTWGSICKDRRTKTTVIYCKFHNKSGIPLTLVLFPTKPFNSSSPWLSWQNPSDENLVIKGLEELKNLGRMVKGNIYLPLLGCGEGGLDPTRIEILMGQYLPDDFYVLVKLKV